MWHNALGFISLIALVLQLLVPHAFANFTNTQPSSNSTPKSNLKLLLVNDDGWAEANIRVLYQELKARGDSPIISAPTEDRSGTSHLRKKIQKLDKAAEYDSVPVGAPGYGSDPEDSSSQFQLSSCFSQGPLLGERGISCTSIQSNDMEWTLFGPPEHINYVNGYPVDAMDYGIRNLSRMYFGGPPDLAITGPNVGCNLGPQAEFSGTYNAAEWAAKQNISAISVSVYGDKDRHSYRYVTPSDSSHIYAKVVVRLLNALVSPGHKAPYLPQGFLLNVNLQKAGPKQNCKAPEDYKFVMTSQYGHGGIKFWKSNQDVHRCGTSTLPSEHHIMDREQGCWASVTVRLSDDDHRANRADQQVVVDLLGNLLTCP